MKKLEAKIQKLEKSVAEIQKRNGRVELDKKWETSLTRRLLLITFTYLAVALYFLYISVERPFLNAVVPALGFLLSTLTLPFFKKIWTNFQK